jgi:uracil-DNA glycosylase
VILGEGGGYNEYIDSKPFRPYAAAGSKLEEVFREASSQLSRPITRSQFLIYNVVNCHPPGDKLAGQSYEQDAIAHCSRYVDAVVGGFYTDKIKTTLALGNIPLKFLTGFSGVAKEKQSITHLRGFVYQGKYGYVVPGLHPSGIKRGQPHLTPLLVEDLKKALAVANGTYTDFPKHPSFREPNYNIAPSLEDAWGYYYRARDNVNLIIGYDIETKESDTEEDERDDLTSNEITQTQFSLGMHEGIALPGSPEYMEVARAMMALPNVKVGHYVWHYDNPIMKANQFVINGKIIDTLWMFKHWHPSLPRGLQSVASLFDFPFPWKHLFGVNLPFYGCADVAVLHYILNRLPKLMTDRGVFRGYARHVVKLNPIFVKASERGIPVSETRWEQVKSEFEVEREKINTELQKVIPDELRNIRPKRKDKDTGELDYGYIRDPKLVREAAETYTNIAPILVSQNKKVVPFDVYVNRKHHATLTADDDNSDLVYADFKNGSETVKRWCIVENFKASSTQLQRYLKYRQGQIEKEIESLKQEREVIHGGRNPALTDKINHLKGLFDDYEIPIHLKTRRPTTSKQELEEIYFNTGDEVLEQTVRVRSLDTNLNNFLPNWKPKKDGRAHPIYGYTAPTGQINSWKPNSQNCSKHTEYGKRFRAIIEAPPGYCFVEADKKSFHVAMMGYNAKDKDYIRFSQIDPHSTFGSYIDPSIIGCSISLKWSDEEIKLASAEFKTRSKDRVIKDPSHGIDVRQSLAKPTILGNQLELGAKKLQRQNQRYIKTVAEADKFQKMIASLFPKPELYKTQIKEIAFRQRYLINEFARIQYFYDVFAFHYDKKRLKWTRKDGEGAREPIAFRIQSPSFGMIDEELLELDRLGVCNEHNFLVTIHDSLMFMPEIRKRDKCIELVHNVMSRPCKQLVNEATGPEGLVVAVEISVGQNWRDMEEIKI